MGIAAWFFRAMGREISPSPLTQHFIDTIESNRFRAAMGMEPLPVNPDMVLLDPEMFGLDALEREMLAVDANWHWDERWMGLAAHIALWSKDRSRKIGCVIVDQDNTLVSMGWNGFPRGSDDDVEARHQRPTKYLWSEHAERNAIYNAARKGVRLEGCKMYLQFFSCVHCARAAIQAGIREIICIEPDWADPTYAEEFAVVKEMLDEQVAKGKIVYRYMPGDPPVRNENI